MPVLSDFCACFTSKLATATFHGVRDNSSSVTLLLRANEGEEFRAQTLKWQVSRLASRDSTTHLYDFHKEFLASKTTTALTLFFTMQDAL